MAIRRKEFQKLVSLVKDFLGKLPSSEVTAELRDALNLSLLHMHRYYKRVRIHTNSSTAIALEPSHSLNGSWNGILSPTLPHLGQTENFDWRWLSLDASKLCASFGHGDMTNFVPEIFYVIKEGNAEDLKKMIKKDPSVVHEIDALGRTTAMYALHCATKRHLECLKVLIENGVDLNQQANDGTASIHVAAHSRSLEIVKEVLNQKVDVNVQDNEGRTALHWACMYPESEIVQLLVDFGAVCRKTDHEGLNPLMWTCYFDHLDNLECLLDSFEENEETLDSAAFIKDANEKSLIHWSVSRPANTDCVKHLITQKTALLVEKDGKSVFMVAAENGCVGGCEEVLSLCGDSVINEVDNYGRTALHLACMSGHGEVVDLLLNRGASQHIKDSKGLTPLDYIKSRQLNYCSLVFLSYQAYNEKALNAGIQRDQEGSKDEIPANYVSLNRRTPERSNIEGNAAPITTSVHRDTDKADVSDIEGFEVQQEGCDYTKKPKGRSVASTPKEILSRGKNEVDSPFLSLNNNIEVPPDEALPEGMNFSLTEENEQKLSVETESFVDHPKGEEEDVLYPNSVQGDLAHPNISGKDIDNSDAPVEDVDHPGVTAVEQIEATADTDEPVDFEFEDQLVVLVEHHGSDDDEHVTFQYGSDINKLENDISGTPSNPVEVDCDPYPHQRLDAEHELLDISHTPKLQSATGTSEQSAAVVSASANFSITSLGIDSEDETEGDGHSSPRTSKGLEDARVIPLGQQYKSLEDISDVSKNDWSPRDQVSPGSKKGNQYNVKSKKGTSSKSRKNEKKGSQIPVRSLGDSSSNLTNDKSPPFVAMSLSPKSGSLGPLEPLRAVQPLQHGKLKAASTKKESEIGRSDHSKNNKERKNSTGQQSGHLLDRRDHTASQIPKAMSPAPERRSLSSGNISHFPKPPS